MTNSSKQGSRKYVLVDDNGLSSLMARPSIGEYVKKLIKRRHFIWAEARSTALQTGQDTWLGRFWIILNPAISVGIYAIVFGLILQVSRGMDNFIGFLTIGVIYFGFVSSSFSVGPGLIRSSKNLIGAFSFPKAALAISAVARQLIDNAVPALLSVVAALLFQLEKTPSWTVVFVIPLYFLLHVMLGGIIFIFARAAAFVPDVKSLSTVISRALFFTSGVFFSLDRFDTHPNLRAVMEANPVYQFLTAVRTCVLDGEVPEISVWIYLIVWSFGLFTFGFIYFWQAEERYAGVK